MVTPHVDRDRERKLLEKARFLRDGISGDRWEIVPDGHDLHIMVERENRETVRICTIHGDAFPDERDLIAGAPGLVFGLLAMVERAAARLRELAADAAKAEKKAKADNFGFQAKSLCEKRGFWRFLEANTPGGAITSALAAETRLKSTLAISSKGDLNSDPEKREAFRQLRARYYDAQRAAP